MAGPELRTDIVEVYVFRRPAGPDAAQGEVEFLQLRRAVAPLAGSWQPVMGHIEEGETAIAAALRELSEESGYGPGRGLLGLWQLEALDVFFMASQNCVMLCPGFAAQVDPSLEPTLDASHDAARWLPESAVARDFFWPGQRQAAGGVLRDIVPWASPSAQALRIAL